MSTQLQSRTELLKNSVAAQNVGQGTELLGYMISFSVGEASYKRQDMEQALITNGLDTIYLPNPVKAEDAFKRAAKGCEVKSWKPKVDSKEYKNFTVRDVVRAGEKRIKNIVVETVNAERERLSYDTEGAILKFDMKTEQMETQWNDPLCQALVDKAQEQFEEFLNTHNGNTVRGSLTKLLYSMSPILMRKTGGVYFVPVQYEDKLLSTVQYINTLAEGDAFCVPMVNNSEGQALLKRKFEEHLQNVIRDCRKVIAHHEEDLYFDVDSENPLNRKKRLEEEKKALETATLAISQFKDYKAILEGEIGNIESAFDIVKSAVEKMTTELAIKPIKKRN